MSRPTQTAEYAEWYYEPDFSKLPDRDLDVVILARRITTDEYKYLVGHVMAYCLFATEGLDMPEGSVTKRLFERKMGRRLSDGEMENLLGERLLDYYSGSYGEKYQPWDLSIAQGFKGKVLWNGFRGVELKGDFGGDWRQAAFWRLNIPIEKDQSLDFWLEYEKDETVNIQLKFVRFDLGSVSFEFQEIDVFTEEELEQPVCLERARMKGMIFASLLAKGWGRLKIIALHDRYSRRGVGYFLPGGERFVASDREEIFYYFDPGNLKPPLNVYFSGYKTQEGFEGYYLMRRFGHPFLLISEARLEGGAFYMGSEEYEDQMARVIEEHLQKLGFDSSQLILSGLSMGTYGALYCGCRLKPHAVLLGKPLASIGDVAANERINRVGGFPTSLDVLKKFGGGLDGEAIQRLNSRFWDAFDRADWSRTLFAVAYMIEDDYDCRAYEMLQSHLKDAGVQIYGKGLHGRHNDDTSGIVGWFVGQYKKIIERDFDRRNGDQRRDMEDTLE